MDNVTDVFPVGGERLSAKEFLKLVRENPALIKSSTVVHPVPGKQGFGSFQVMYSRPLYRSLSGLKARTLKK